MATRKPRRTTNTARGFDGHATWAVTSDPDLEVSTVTAERSIDETWAAVGEFVIRDEDLRLASVAVIPWNAQDDNKRKLPRPAGEWDREQAPVPASVTARLLRKVPLTDLEQLARQQLASQRGLDAGLDRLADYAERSPAVSRDRMFAEWARAYVAAVDGGSRRPNEDLADSSGLTTSQVRDRIHEVRRAGFLTGGGHGRIGGQLTAKALATLNNTKETDR